MAHELSRDSMHSADGDASSELNLPSSPSSILWTQDDQELFFSVMNANQYSETGNNFWFPPQGDAATQDGSSPASPTSPTPTTATSSDDTKKDSDGTGDKKKHKDDKKKLAQSVASKKYRSKKKAVAENLSIENGFLKTELASARQQLHGMTKEIAALKAELLQAQAALQNMPALPSPNHFSSDDKGALNPLSIMKDLKVSMDILLHDLGICGQFSLDLHAPCTNPVMIELSFHVHLGAARALVLKHHISLCNAAKKIIAPDMQAYWALFEPPHTPPQTTVQALAETTPECVFAAADTHNAWWRQFSEDAVVTTKQLEDITHLQRRYCQTALKIKAERFQYSRKIREYYWKRIYRIQFRFPGPGPKISSDPADLQQAQLELLFMLTELKKNVDSECSMLAEMYVDLSKILKPLQEALLYVKLYQEAQSHLDHFHPVHGVWEKVHSFGPG